MTIWRKYVRITSSEKGFYFGKIPNGNDCIIKKTNDKDEFGVPIYNIISAKTGKLLHKLAGNKILSKKYIIKNNQKIYEPLHK